MSQEENVRVPLQMEKINVKVDAYILDLGGLDLILGVAWLQSLGKITMDYKDMTMSFVSQDTPVLLQGLGGSRCWSWSD